MMCSTLATLCIALWPIMILSGNFQGQTEPSQWYLNDDIQHFPKPVESAATSAVLAPAGDAAASPAARSQIDLRSLARTAGQLDQIGLREEAEALRELTAEIRQKATAQLEMKMVEAQRLHQEIQTLKALCRADGAHHIQVQVLEADPAAMEALTAIAGQHVRSAEIAPASFDLAHASWGPVPTADVNACIDELKQSKALKILSAFSMVVRDGNSAVFHSGGQFPVPLPEGGVQMRDYGTRFEATPERRLDGRVQLGLSVEISDVVQAEAVVVNGMRVPGLNSRAVNGRVETMPGQSLLLGGLRSEAGGVLIVVVALDEAEHDVAGKP